MRPLRPGEKPREFDPAFRRFIMARNEFFKKEGVLAGSSGGAVVFAALEVALRLGPGKRVATIIPDSAERYLSKKIFEGGI